jgi:SpoIID/LytB domain protein
MRVSDGKRLVRPLRAGTYGVGPRLVLPVRRRGRSLSFGRVAVFYCARAPLALDGREYHGTLLLRSDGRHVSVVNTLSLDNYVRGVVPSESPSHWPLAELEAQAVAARSYAVSELRPDSWYDLLPTTADQVYGGVGAERSRSDQAVDKTLGEILTWNGQVARTYYSSSSGGRTEAVQDAWPGSAPIPYLRSVPDPYDTYSPLHDWGPFELSAGQMAARLGLGSAAESVLVRRDDSLRAESVLFRLSSGAVVSRSAERVEQALHLRSTWFSIGELQLSTSSPRVLYGRTVRVVARAPNVTGALLQERRGAGAWRTLRRLDRPVGLSVEPHANTAFRLTLPGTSGTSVAVAVVPRLQVQALSPRLLGGEVLPRPDAPVEVWRLDRGHWRVVAHPILDARGAFRTPLPLRPVAYKVTVAGDGRLAAAERWVHVTRRLLATLRN